MNVPTVCLKSWKRFFASPCPSPTQVPPSLHTTSDRARVYTLKISYYRGEQHLRKTHQEQEARLLSAGALLPQRGRQAQTGSPGTPWRARGSGSSTSRVARRDSQT